MFVANSQGVAFSPAAASDGSPACSVAAARIKFWRRFFASLSLSFLGAGESPTPSQFLCDLGFYSSWSETPLANVGYRDLKQNHDVNVAPSSAQIYSC